MIRYHAAAAARLWKNDGSGEGSTLNVSTFLSLSLSLSLARARARRDRESDREPDCRAVLLPRASSRSSSIVHGENRDRVADDAAVIGETRVGERRTFERYG